VAVAPMVAPIIGALLLEFFSWRFIFLMQSAMVFVTFIVTLNFKETIAEKVNAGYLRLFGRYAVHLRNRQFVTATMSMTMIVFPFYGFIAFSPVYYISIFGLSEKMFSLFFAVNAVSAMTGAYLSPKISKKLGNSKTITLIIAGCIASGAGIFLFADKHYMFMAFFMSVCSVMIGISRPVSGAVILGLVDTDIGSASSFLVFYQFIGGALSMWLVTLQWSSPVAFFGMFTVLVSSFVLILWLKISGRLSSL
jgi:DHA1 family bicyclomycin/chloramphenicol resistance-like MFS transporter